MNSTKPKGIELSGPTARPYGSLFFSGAAMAFAAAVIYRWFLFSQNGAQLTSSPITIGFYAFLTVSAVLALIGAIDLARNRGGLITASLEGTKQLRTLTNSALASLSLTLISFFYIGGTVFENQETGFPLQFSFRTDLNGYGPLHFQPLPAILDFGFWLAISYLFLSGVPFRSRFVRGSFEAIVGVSVGFFFSVMVTGISYQTFSLPELIISPFFLLFNLAVGYIQIRRGFTIMGLAVAGTGILLAILLILD